MKPIHFASLFLACALPLVAQTPAAVPTPQAPAATQAPVAAAVPQMHRAEIGFGYAVPSDWEVVDAAPMAPALKQKEAKTAESADEKKGIACTDLPLTARHGDPASVILTVSLPFECFGQSFTDNDLPAFGMGVSEWLKKTFTISEPLYGAYTLGTHSLWIERATGVSIEHPEMKRTLETACVILKKGAICRMALAADEDAIRTFERGAVELDGEAFPALVPDGAFKKKP